LDPAQQIGMHSVPLSLYFLVRNQFAPVGLLDSDLHLFL